MKEYLAEKLTEINYRMEVHPGDANRRLASEAGKILLLPANQVPNQFKLQFGELVELSRKTLENLSAPGLTPTRIASIRSTTATKYIKLLLDIEVAVVQR